MTRDPQPQPQPGDSLVYTSPEPASAFSDPMPGLPEAAPPVPAPVPETVQLRVPAQGGPVEPPYPVFPAPPAPPGRTSFAARAKPVLGAARAGWRRVSALLIWAVKVAVRLVAAVLLVHAAFSIFKANTANVWYQVIDSWAGTMSLGLTGLFDLPDARWEALVNHGLAAAVWLVAGSVAAGLLRRITP
ncbi:hypothetical protein [Nonomuraea typhae]|uniref:hypothetical protein n=1 Tax=Nonomuraea typhae TaxID=2603600 RepID=UPI0012F71C74|nr:hypothetical protein [Nonomuraea typhae]